MISALRCLLSNFPTLVLLGISAHAAALSPDQQQCLAKGHRFERQGWIYLHLEGEPKERGFQHGYLLAPEIADGLRTTRISWEYSSAMPWPWLVERAGVMFTPRLDAETKAEMDGIAEGMRAAGHPTTRDELVAYNGIIELSGYWWPTELKKIRRCAGRIDLALAKQFEADHFDTYLRKNEPDGRTLCGHYELGREPAGSWPGVPFGCAGTVDAKVLDAAMARAMGFAARWGSACGRAFDARQCLRAHPQFDWMKDILKSRPSQPWTQFWAGE